MVAGDATLKMIRRGAFLVVVALALCAKPGTGEQQGVADRIADQLLARFVVNVSLHTMVKQGALDRIAAQPDVSIERKLAWGLVIYASKDKKLLDSAIKLAATLEQTVGRRQADNAEYLDTLARQWAWSFADDAYRKSGDQIEVAMDLSINDDRAGEIARLAAKLQANKTDEVQAVREKVRKHFLELAKADKSLESALAQVENAPVEVANARRQLVAVLAKATP